MENLIEYSMAVKKWLSTPRRTREKQRERLIYSSMIKRVVSSFEVLV